MNYLTDWRGIWIGIVDPNYLLPDNLRRIEPSFRKSLAKWEVALLRRL